MTVAGPGEQRPALSRATADRAAHVRTDEAALTAAWADPRARVLVVVDGKAPVINHDAGASLVFVNTAAAPGGERYFLGLDADGSPFFAVAADAGWQEPDGGAVLAGATLAAPREVGALLDDRDAGLLVHAVALERWHERHPRCPLCGTPTEVGAAGHLRRCPADGSEHYPRTDPAVIMLVVDDSGRCLLGHQPSWPDGRFSTLAGFVEPGESLELAVCREVAEEVGLSVQRVEYVTSQPWPFPSSLMLAFVAHVAGTGVAVEPLPDGVEISEAHWYDRATLRQAVDDGRLRLPSRVSVAYQLIDTWYRSNPGPSGPTQPGPCGSGPAHPGRADSG